MTTQEVTVTKEETSQAERPTCVPYVDIQGSPEATMLQIEMPGVDEPSLEASLEHNILTVAGTASMPAPEGHRLVRQEFAAARFVREFEITNDVDRQAVQARIKDGLLTVTLPRGEAAKPRKIAITAG